MLISAIIEVQLSERARADIDAGGRRAEYRVRVESIRADGELRRSRFGPVWVEGVAPSDHATDQDSWCVVRHFGYSATHKRAKAAQFGVLRLFGNYASAAGDGSPDEVMGTYQLGKDRRVCVCGYTHPSKTYTNRKRIAD